MGREIHRYKTRLNLLFKQIENLPDEEFVRSHWSRYLCVLVSGYLEVAVKEVLGDYALSCCPNKNVSRYVESQLRKLQNPKMQKILELTAAFSPEWQEELAAFAEGEPKGAIDSIVDNKNLIAHGKDTGISFDRIRTYYQQADKVVEKLIELCQQ